MSLSSSSTQLLIAGVALALLAPSASKACMGGGVGIPAEVILGGAAATGAVALLTLPFWIQPAITGGLILGGLGAVNFVANKVGEAQKKSSDRAEAALQDKNELVEYWKGRSEQARPFFEEAEKNPTSLSLFRLGAFLFTSGDMMSARKFLRRSLDLMEKEDKPELAMLAFAHSQMGDIQMRLQCFADAYDHFVETKNVMDQIQATVPAEIKTKKQKQKEQESGGHLDASNSITLLGEEDLTHKIGWSLLHKALYDVPHEEFDKKVADLVNSATEMLHATRTVSAEWELHYCIANFYNVTQWFYENAPHTPDDEQHFDTDPFHKKFTPKFLTHVTTDVLPPLLEVLAKLEAAPNPNKVLIANANIYIGRCRFVAGEVFDGWNNFIAARDLLHPNFSEPRPDDITLYGIDFSELGKEAYNAERHKPAERPRRGFHTILRCIAAHRLNNGHASDGAPHAWEACSFKKPTWCAKCQGFITLPQNFDKTSPCQKCRNCGFAAHNGCAEALGDDALCRAVSTKSSLKDHVHVMKKCMLTKPTFCFHCSTFIGNFLGAAQCQLCGVQCHDECVSHMNQVAATDK